MGRLWAVRRSTGGAVHVVDENPENYPHGVFLRARAEKVVAISATLLFQRGLRTSHPSWPKWTISPWSSRRKTGGKAWYELILDFSSPLLERFTEDVSQRTFSAAREVAKREAYGVNSTRARSILPEENANWRQLASVSGGARPSNHVRRVRVGPAQKQMSAARATQGRRYGTKPPVRRPIASV